MHYVSTTEKQIIKLSSKYISNLSLYSMIKAEGQLHKGTLLLHKVLYSSSKVTLIIIIIIYIYKGKWGMNQKDSRLFTGNDCFITGKHNTIKSE